MWEFLREVEDVIAATGFELVIPDDFATTRLPTVDALIAATALQRGAVLLHADNHFRAIPLDGLATVDIRDAARSTDFPSPVREPPARYRVRTDKAKPRNRKPNMAG